jgi:excisionase family DNA binding protein
MSRDVTYLTPRQVADRWACSPRHVRRLCAAGELRAMRLGLDAWRISIESVEAFEQARTSTTPAAATETPKQEASRSREVQPATVVDGFTLPADYVPCFPDLWPGHEPRATKKAALTSQ